jgi:PAS domain S-box-containing protein
VRYGKPIGLFSGGILAIAVAGGCDQKPTRQMELAHVTSAPAPLTNKVFPGNTTSPAAISDLEPLFNIRSLNDRPTESTNHTVRVQGKVLDEQSGEFIVINDGTGTILAETHQAALPPVNELADLSGQPFSDGYAVSLKNATARLVTHRNGTNQDNAMSLLPPASLPQLTKVWMVRDLPAEKAAWHYPVRLRAVVTVNAHYKDYFFAQDDSAGITVRVPEISAGLNPGDLVDISGVSDPGGYSPIVLASNVTVIGSAPLPEARAETLFQLATGQDGSQWIEVRGVIRSATYNPTNGMAQLNLKDLSGAINVNVRADHEPLELLDAIVRIRGACGSKANEKREFVASELWASSLAEVQIEEPGLTDPLSQPAQPIASLNQFHPRQTLQHRLNVAGVVTLVDEEFFFIQDPDSGVRVQVATEGKVKPGDYVIAAGYPSLGEYGNLLQNAVFKVIGHRPVPAPLPLSTKNPLDPQLHDRWVQVQARFLHYSKIGSVDVLTLQLGNRIFDARFIAPVSMRMKTLQPGSLLQVNGIYRQLTDAARVPKSLQLAVPVEEDVRILEEPSWWTVSHATTVIGLMGAAIGTAILWVLLLRRKVQEQTASLKQSEQQFRSLVEQSLVGIYILQDNHIVYANPCLADIFGYAPEEILAPSHWDDLVFWEDRAKVREQIRRRIANETDSTHYHFRGRRKDGSVIQIEALGCRTEFKGRPAVLGMLLDITERKLAQDKIAEQARMLDLASDAIVVCDLEGRIQYWNQNAQRIYGWTAPQALGAPAFEKMCIPPDDFQQARKTLLLDHQWHGEFIHRDPHGGELIVAARWTLVLDSQGKPGSILTINTDISQQKKLEAQFLRTQRLDSIGVLAGGIAHDLNNVLAPILMSGQLLEMDPDIPLRRKMIATILASTHRAASLVKQILTFARGSGGVRHAVSPNRVLEEVRKILHETLPKSINLQITKATELRMITADATQLNQVLMNLCLNACDAMEQGGELAVTVTDVELPPHDHALGPGAKPGAYVVFSVTDTGIGMAPDIRERIFDPFFTTKPIGKGTGLGLSTALGIVKSHGGFIQVQSQPGRGSCFKVHLPVQSDHPPDTEKAPPETRLIHGKNELILVVDDEAPLRTIAKQMLTMFGYRVLTANNGQEAVALYQQHQDEIALVFTDMMMPVMNGAASIEALFRINPRIKIVAVSGLELENQVSPSSRPAVRAFIAKPYTAEKLLNVIREVLKEKTSETPAAA